MKRKEARMCVETIKDTVLLACSYNKSEFSEISQNLTTIKCARLL